MDDGGVRNAALETLAFGQALAGDMGASLELLLLCADPERFEGRLIHRQCRQSPFSYRS